MRHGLRSNNTLTTALVLAIGAALAFSGTGCLVGPDPRTPDIRMPEDWGSALAPATLPRTGPSTRTSQASTRPLDLVNWWSLFNDPALDALVDRAVKANLDVRSATAQVRQARAARTVAASALFPTLGGTGAYRRSFSGGSSITTSGGTVVRSNKNPQDLFQEGLDASWEIDLFGGQRRNVQAADANILAQSWNRRSIMVTVLAEVASDYIQIRGLQRQIRIAKDNVALQERTADLTRRRQRGGFQTGLDVANAEAAAASSSATIPILEQSLLQTMHALGLLLAQPPGQIDVELAQIQSVPLLPPEVPIGLPSDLLRRRPDVRYAEYLLQRQTALIGAAVANLYPSFSLTGSGGLQGSRFSNLGEWSTRFWSFGPGVNWPLIDFGAVRGNIEAQSAVEEQSLYAYQQSVLQSLTDVANALVGYTKEQEHHKALADAAAAERRAYDLALLLYNNGQTDFLNVLVAEESLFSADNALVQSTTTLDLNMIALYKALGGGWQYSDIPPIKTTPPIAPSLNVPITLTR